ncbi:MAG TPA: sporulation protein YqfD [Firmicutes bacterium]|nr:sporulation protein YqfD [Bacillota bacterium]
MFLIRWWRFCRGYLVVLVSGQGVERFLNLALVRGISFWDLQKSQQGAQLSIGLPTFKRLRPLVKKSRCRLHIIRKSGLPFEKVKLRRRRGLVLGALFFLTVIYILTSFIWFIEVTGNQMITEKEVLQLVEQLGVRPGTWKKKLNLFELEQDISRLHSGISWAGCRIRGTLLEIEIAEHLVEPEPDSGPADLVAAKDGLIERVLIIEGQAVVKPGDTVSKGDLLIRGIRTYNDYHFSEGEQPPPEAVQAKGEVEARVWYEASVQINTKGKLKVESGNYKTGYYLSWPEGSLYLWGARNDPYEISRQEASRLSLKWRNLFFPVEVKLTRYYEIIVEERDISPEQALLLSREEAKKQARSQIPEGVPAGATFFEECTVQGRRGVRAVVETRENIATLRVQQP